MATLALPAALGADAPALTSLSFEDGVLQDDAWWVSTRGPTNLTFTLTHAGGEGHTPIRLVALRLETPSNQINVQGPEPAAFVNATKLAGPGSWTVEPRNLDAGIDGPSDDVAETLELRAAGDGLPAGQALTFRVHIDVRAEDGWAWLLRTAAGQGANERTAARILVKVDTAPPAFAVEGLALPGATNATSLWLNGTFQEATSSNPSGLAPLRLVLDGPTPTDLTLPVAGGAFAHRLELAGLTEGVYEATFVAADRAGNDAGLNGTLVVDRTAPEVHWTSPTLAPRRPVVLTWNATDNVGPVTGVDVLRFVNGAWVPVAEGLNDTSLALTGLLHGDRARLRLVGHDLAGNHGPNPEGENATLDHVVTVDLVAPEVLGVELATTEAGHRLTVRARDAESGLANATATLVRRAGSGIERLDTAEVGPDGEGAYTFVFATRAMAPGAYGVELTVRDRAGHAAAPDEAIELFVGDTLPVSVNLPTPPAGQSAYRADQPVVLTATVAAAGEHTVTVDATGLGHADPVLLRDDGLAPDARAGDRAFTASLPVVRGNGLVTLTVRASSQDGANGVATALVPVDTLAPQVTILEPRGGAVAPTATLRVEAVDERPGVRLSEVRAGGEPLEFLVTPDAASGGLVLVVDALGLPAGSTLVEVEATDGAGNAGIASVTLDVDASPPEVVARFEGPRAPRGTWFTGPVTIHVDASDPETGVTRGIIALGDGLFGDGPITLRETGPHEVRLSATNGVGLRTVETLVVGIDGQVPSIDSVTLDERGDRRVLVVEASDDVGLEGVVARLAGVDHPLTAVGQTFVLQLPTDAPDEAVIVATDPAGNQGTTSFKLEQSEVAAASWIAVVLVLGLLSASQGARRR